MEKKKFILFSEIYDVEKYDRQPLPVDIFNSTGAILAHKGHSLSKERIINSYIYVDDIYTEKEMGSPLEASPPADTAPEKKKINSAPVLQVKKEAVPRKTSKPVYQPSYPSGFELSDKYKEESAEAISKRLIDLDFEPIPTIRKELRANIYNLKEIFQSKIVDNMTFLASKNNEKLSMHIAEYLDYVLEINMYATDYLDMVTAIRNRDNYNTFSHSLAVAFYAMAIAKKLKMLREDYILNDNLGRWVPIKTRKNASTRRTIPLSNQLLKYFDYQKGNISAKYDYEIRDILFEQLHDLMHEYAKIQPQKSYSSLMAEYNEENRKLIAVAGINLDIGKLAIPNRILNKKGKLSPEEWNEMMKHPVYSVVKLKEVDVENPVLFAYILGHHLIDPERSYPAASKKPSPESKILALADMYDAMTSPRHYGTVHSHAEALQFIKALFERDLIDLPLYLTAWHTFQEFNHEHVQRRRQKIEENKKNNT